MGGEGEVTCDYCPLCVSAHCCWGGGVILLSVKGGVGVGLRPHPLHVREYGSGQRSTPHIKPSWFTVM